MDEEIRITQFELNNLLKVNEELNDALCVMNDKYDAVSELYHQLQVTHASTSAAAANITQLQDELKGERISHQATTAKLSEVATCYHELSALFDELLVDHDECLQQLEIYRGYENGTGDVA